MTLAEKITELRTEYNLSQGDLAEKIGVSRQSISKWETGASIPELDKLILLADLFSITLDALVKGETIPQKQEAEEKEMVYAAPKEHSTQKIIAACLLILGGISAILGFAILPPLLFLAVYLLFCSIVCFAVRRYAGLVIAWITFLGLVILSPYIFGAHIFFALSWGGLAVTILWMIWKICKTKKA